MNTKYIFVTGGVVSSLGKGIISASIGKLLQARGFKVTIQKFDPYINIDPGTLNPYEHGECYVTVDGMETDLDLGHYERFTGKNTSGTELGTLTVGGGATNIDGVNYTLALTGYDLIVMVGDDLVPPEVVNVMADETAMTNQEVTVTAEFTDNIEVASKQYRIGDGAWTDYPSGGVTVSENTTVYFKATDTADNESEIVSYEVANIDKVAPTISNITPSTTEPTDSVTVTANFKDDVALASMLYMLGLSGEWKDYPDEGVVVTRNATVYFKAVSITEKMLPDNSSNPF